MVGFLCLICRCFVFVLLFIVEIEKWVEFVFINKMVNMLNEKCCDVCKWVDEEEVVSDWCKLCLEFICGFCVKVYKRNVFI